MRLRQGPRQSQEQQQRQEQQGQPGAAGAPRTLMTRSAAPAFERRQMPPAASPGGRGTVTLFIAKPRRAATPSAAGSARKASTLVSWKVAR